jgi:hypothetical protein
VRSSKCVVMCTQGGHPPIGLTNMVFVVQCGINSVTEIALKLTFIHINICKFRYFISDPLAI